ncbi:two-component system sensor histidine kinase RppB [Spirulina major]|uniref:two-component system sensor histidine kinase RppB n=1 Tax=Spirulina major TaxID=270636 RepID=UPI000934A249|nr:two-component system sensor histidine kinase RppB [Spirulina major]
MNRQRLFARSRRQLASAYSGVMGVILAGLGFGVYQAIAHAHQITADRELKSVAGTLHDSLQWKLQDPGRIDPILTGLLPNLCQPQKPCSNRLPPQTPHHLSALHQGNYYVRLWNTTGQLVATAGQVPASIVQPFNPQAWQTVRDPSTQQAYHQLSIALHTRDRQDWGTLQVGRSLQDTELYLSNVRWALILGIPVAMLIVMIASSRLAGLAMRPIDQAYQQIQQFTADAAHELRTPIAAILATVETAQLAESPDHGRADILKIVQRQSLRLSQLVADLLLLSRLEQQPNLTQQQPCCLTEIIEDLIEEMAALAIAAQLTLHTQGTAQPLWVQGHSDALYRLISNLIMNAIQYTPAGGKILITLTAKQHHAEIQVQDNGCGIPPSDQSKIFDRFYRVDQDRSRTHGGAGLGLAIAQAIAHHHHGTLTVQSQLNQGSCFLLRLPLARNPSECPHQHHP